MGLSQSSKVNNNNNNNAENNAQDIIQDDEPLKMDFESLQELADEFNGNKFKQLLKGIWEISDEEEKKNEINKIQEWISTNKEKFSPEQNLSELSLLKAEMLSLSVEDNNDNNNNNNNNNNEKEEKRRKMLVEIAEIREANKEVYKLYEKTFGKIDRLAAPLLNSIATSGGRSNRAKRSGLVSSHAGKTKIEGAATDKHGNADGSEFDLGVDGAFKDFKIIVFQFYQFTKEYTVKAFEKKGFQYDWHTSANDIPIGKFREMIFEEKVCQIWIISSSSSNCVFSPEQLAALLEFHQKGKSLYIWGDNTPFIHDANTVLKTLFPKQKVEMTGNFLASKTVKETPSYDIKSKNNCGFLAHMVTTGLVHLFEGVTVASFAQIQDVLDAGFTPLLFGSEFNLTTIVRPADKEGGAVIADGAFTRLYCNVDDAGTIRYIINAACWLALETLNFNPFDGDDEEENEVDVEEENYDEKESFSSGVCSILYTAEPIIYIPVLSLGDPDINTSDGILNDPLGFGDLNYHILGRNLYGEKAGKVVKELGKDPYQRTSIAGLLPAVSFTSKKNVRLFTDELCRVYLGRRNLRSAAQMLFVSSLDSVLHPDRIINLDDQTRNVYEYLFNQSLDHFQTTADFTDLGDKVPLINAMISYFSVSPQLTQISKSFSTVCLIGRSLFHRNLMKNEELTPIVRRSFIKLLLSSAIKFVKDCCANKNNEKEGGEAVVVDGNLEFRRTIFDLLFTTFNHIPKINSGRLINSLPHFFPSISSTLSRYENTCNVKISFSSINSFIYHLLTSFDLRSFRVEMLIQTLRTNELFKKIWDDSEVPSDQTILELINSRFANLTFSPGVHAETAPFATIHGPSCYSCNCGFSFGDPSLELTDQYIEEIKKRRNEHFKEVYNSDANGYPTLTSSFCSIHRVTYRVMQSLFPMDLEKKPEMVVEISKELLSIGKGNTYVNEFERDVNDTIDGFLVQRKKFAEIPPLLTHFNDKIRLEQSQIRQGL